jgi:integrase/recombinase XerD
MAGLIPAADTLLRVEDVTYAFKSLSITNDVVLSQPMDGPLSAHIRAFAQWARDQGYARGSRYRHVLLAACFSRWLGQQAISIRRISAEHSARYLRSRARRVQIHRGDAAALGHFVDFLRHDGVIRSMTVARPPPSPVDRATQAFEHYLRDERVLAEATITYYVRFVREFLTDRFGRGRVTLGRLCAGDVVRFGQRRASRLHVKRAKQLTTALRAFLRYVRYRGDITHDLVAAVPSVANWSMPSIPRAIPAASVRQLLASINRQTAKGRRD